MAGIQECFNWWVIPAVSGFRWDQRLPACVLVCVQLWPLTQYVFSTPTLATLKHFVSPVKCIPLLPTQSLYHHTIFLPKPRVTFYCQQRGVYFSSIMCSCWDRVIKLASNILLAELRHCVPWNLLSSHALCQRHRPWRRMLPTLRNA